MPLASFARPVVLSTCAAVMLTALSGCNSHSVVGVKYDRSGVCGESIMIPVVAPRVVLVVDRSGSMSDNPLGTQTRWSALHGVISQVVDGQDANTQFGLAMFPAEGAGDTFPDGACEAPAALDVAVGADTGAAIMSAMPTADAMTHGGTPAASAVDLAADHLRAIDGDDPKLMVLVTDGAANCAPDATIATAALYDEGLQDAVAAAYMDGITTYVVGIQISTELDPASGVVAAEQLDEVALLGGAALDDERKFYSVEDQAALSAALDSITAELGCTMELGEELDPDREAALRVAGEYTSEISDCASEDGWMYGEDGASIQLCGQACSDFQASGEILFEYICE